MGLGTLIEDIVGLPLDESATRVVSKLVSQVAVGIKKLEIPASVPVFGTSSTTKEMCDD